MPTKLRHLVTGTVQTTNATATTIASYALPDECVAIVETHVLGQRQASTNIAAYIRRARYSRQSGGGATESGEVDGGTWEDVASWNATLAPSGNNVTVTVQGVAGATIDWYCELEVWLYAP